MALIQCRECKKEISSQADKCPHCGFNFAKETEDIIKGIGCLVFIIIFLCIFFAGDVSMLYKKTWNKYVDDVYDLSEPQQKIDPEKEIRLETKFWLQQNLKDPKSLEIINYGPIEKTDKGMYFVRVKYRAKNSFGGYDVETYAFYLTPDFKITESILCD